MSPTRLLNLSASPQPQPFHFPGLQDPRAAGADLSADPEGGSLRCHPEAVNPQLRHHRHDPINDPAKLNQQD